MSVELIPSALVVGAFTPPLNQGIPGLPKIGTRQLTEFYGAIADEYGYRSFTLNSSGDGCQIVGRTADDMLTITPPTVQLVQELATRLTVDVAANQAEAVFREMGTRLKLPLFGLGVRLVYRGSVPGGDARSFALSHFLGRGQTDLDTLGQADGQPVWGGVKFVVNPVTAPGATYTVTIEPLVADLSMLYIDVDAQLQTAVDPALLKAQIGAVESYVKASVVPLLQAGSPS